MEGIDRTAHFVYPEKRKETEGYPARGWRPRDMKVNETDSAGITLLKKGHRGLIRALFSRLGLIVALLLVQALVLLALAY